MVAAHSSSSAFLDRDSERDALERLVAGVRAGRSHVLVLRGEAGVGKTALLRHLSEAARGCRIARTAGVESEMELAFSGLHALCAHMLDHLGHLPGPQRDAVSTAFGLSAGPSPDRFLVGLAVLSLLADAAEEQPLVCIVDDAQWLDRVSAQTLAFVARRLLAERVGLVFALRESGDEHVLEGLPELLIEGLGRRRGPAASGRGDPWAARRAGEGADPRRGRRQSARAARAAARIDAGGARGRVRDPRRRARWRAASSTPSSSASRRFRATRSFCC